ncbi:MAG: hypothetical protein ACTSPI_01450 [Candidatus Heimdallarchaeaceae archaeon]
MTKNYKLKYLHDKRVYPLNLKDVIETLLVYNIEHTKFPHNYFAEIDENTKVLGGLAMDDKKLILIDQDTGNEEMREIIIHELIHTKHFRKGDLRGMKSIEDHVDAETALTYLKLYGVKP